MTPKPCVFVLYNLRSGKASLQERDRIYRIAHDRLDLSRFQLCFKDALELDRNFYDALDKTVELQPEHLVVVGGDGTIQTTLTQLIRLYESRLPGKPMPRTLVLPSGTMNDLATSLGLFNVLRVNLPTLLPTLRFRTKSVTIFQRFVKALNAGSLEHVNVPVIKAVADGREDEAQCGFIFGTGPLVKLISAYHHRKGDFRGRSTRGTIRAMEAGLLTISDFSLTSKLFNGGKRFRPMKGIVSSEDQSYSNPLTVIASTIPKLGLLGLSPFYFVRGEKNLCREGTKAHVIVLKMQPRQLGWITLWKGLTGQIRSHPEAIMLETDRVSFRVEEPLDYLLDAQTEYPISSPSGTVSLGMMRAQKELSLSVGAIQVPFVKGFGSV